MPESLPTSAAGAELHHRRRHAPPHASRAEVLVIVERAARVTDGLALLEGAPLECVAVLLGVDPRAVERVRVTLTADAALRAEAARHHQRLAGGRRAATPAPPPAPRAPRDPQELLLAALHRDDGIALLLSAAPEAAAVAFGVHPDLVHRARAAADVSPA